MGLDLIEFGWSVAKAGYFWKNTRYVGQPEPPPPLPEDAPEREQQFHRLRELESRPKTFLTEVIPFGAARQAKIIHPLHDFSGTLHREFGETELTPEGVQSFANRFGELGGDITRTIPVEATKQGHRLGAGEDIGRWLAEMSAVADALGLWDAVREHDQQTLSQRISWHDGYVVANWDDRRSVVVASTKHRPDIFCQLKVGDLIEPGTLAVQQIVNARLWEKVRVAPKLVWNMDSHELEQQLVPVGLIGAIWLDFAMAIDGKTEYRRCIRCGKAFPLAAKGKRRKFCSSRCRVAHFREKASQD